MAAGPAAATDDEAPAARARRLLLPGAAPPEAGADPQPLAWALKDLCYEAWSTEPARAVMAAEVLAALAAQVPADDEVQALAAWTGGIAQATQAQMAEAVRGFDAAAAAFGRAGLPDPAAQTQVPKIMALSMLGQHDEAAACAEQTQRTLRRLGNLRAASRVSLNLGGLLLRRDAYAQAAPHYREAAVLFARVGGAAHSVIADIGLADALTYQGDFDEALRIYARARMRAGHHGFGMLLALVDESQALVDLARGRYTEALAGLESARRRYAALALPQYLAIAEKALADLYLELRLLPEALALFDTAVAQFEALALPDEQAWALVQRGRTLSLLGRGEAASVSLVAAAALFAAQGNAVGEAAVALARAELALGAGDAAAALALATAASEGFAAAGQADGRARADVLGAQALLADGRVDEAGARFQAALAQAVDHQQAALQVACHGGLGRVAQARGQAAEAEAQFEAAVQGFEDQQRALPGDDLRRAFLADHLRPYQELLRSALAGGDAAPVLLRLDRFRARALGESLAAAADPDGRRERLAWLVRRLQKVHEEAGSSPVLSEERRRTEQALLEQVRRERLARPQPAGGAADGWGIADLQAALAPGDALVEYGVQGDELFACVATHDGVRLCRELAPWPAVQDTVRALRFQLDALRHGVAPVRQHLEVLTRRVQARLQALAQQVWAPLALQGVLRVMLVPHGVLGAVPFVALVATQAGTPGPLLAQAPSARVGLRGLQRQPAVPHSVLALGESSRLPHAAREAAFVAGLSADGRALVGAQATLAALQAGAGSADVLHLACHAEFRADNPRFSALHLHDGPLTVDLAEALQLRAGVVVLSACETGLADAGLGDESVGLVRGFLVGGAARVLASLWPVDDEVSADFMTGFYAALAAGQAPAAALQAAQQRVKRTRPHPHFWGAFALHGGF